VDFGSYQHLLFERLDDGVLMITINRPERMNAMNERLHLELSRVFYDIDIDDDTGENFSSGGDLEMVARMTSDGELIRRQVQETLNMVHGIINCSKVVISAIEGYAVGAGLVVALLSDLSIASETCRLNDGHMRLGVVPGDHAVLIWPLLCGMARAKYYLLTGEFIDGKRAAEIGLVSLAVPQGEALTEAHRIASKMAQSPPQALSWAKRSLNSWLRSAAPAFEQSLAFEMLSFGYPEVVTQVQQLKKGG
jgi:enoyl-CoA hydratase